MVLYAWQEQLLPAAGLNLYGLRVVVILADAGAQDFIVCLERAFVAAGVGPLTRLHCFKRDQRQDLIPLECLYVSMKEDQRLRDHCNNIKKSNKAKKKQFAK